MRSVAKGASSVLAALRTKKSGPAGFTLLELLLVVMIVGIISAIAVPIYHDHLETVLLQRTIAELKAIEVQLNVYYLEKHEYPASLETMGNVPVDPWGNPYRYQLLEGKPLSGPGKVSPRKNRFLHPLNTDFDLYSIGPDGASQLALTAAASHDDVIRADNGSYVGLAKYY